MREVTVSQFSNSIEKREQELLKELRNKCKIKDNPEGLWNALKHFDRINEVNPELDWYNDDRVDLYLVAMVYGLLLNGILTKVAISMPRRRGKTRITDGMTSVFIGENSNKTNIRSAHSDDLLEDSSEKIKNFLNNDRFKDLYPDIEIPKRTKVMKWGVKGAVQKTMTFVSSYSSSTGKGANGMLQGDDLIKGLADYFSVAKMKTLNQFVKSVFRSSKEKGVVEVQIGTRWGENDIIGNLLESESCIKFDAYDTKLTKNNVIKFIIDLLEMGDKLKEKWVYVTIPALDKDDESTCPQLATSEELRKIRKQMIRDGEKHLWLALYQQRPLDAMGKLAKEENFNWFDIDEFKKKYLDNPNLYLERIFLLDPAGAGSNKTCVGYLYVVDDLLYLVDVYYEKYDTNATKIQVVEGILEHECSFGLCESNGLGGVNANDLQELLDEDGSYTDIIKFNSSANKELKIFVNSGTVKNHVVLRKDKKISENYKLFLEDIFNYKKMVKNQDDDGWDMLSNAKKLLNIISDI
jgi:predicted phage terminase large subunit-like protein